MAEPQKEASAAVDHKKKDSLLELDFGNDFLTSWKSTSITGDDAMDLDFGPISKGKKKAFAFDKGDMDFNLDGDFGKLPSFNIDMPDIDFSSPIKKDANSKEKLSEEPNSRSNKAKADRFSFDFDFNELDNFGFKSNSDKFGTKDKKDAGKENSPDRSGSKQSADQFPEDNDSLLDKSTRSICTPEKVALITSSFDAQVGDDGPAACSTTGNHLSNTNDDGQLTSTDVLDRTSSKEITIVDKTKAIDKQQSDSELHKDSPERVSEGACLTTEAASDVSLHSSATESGRDTMSEVPEYVTCRTMVTNPGEEQSFDKNEMVGSVSSCGSPVESSPSLQHSEGSQKYNGGSQDSADVHTSVGNKVGGKHAQCESLVGQASSSAIPTEFAANKHEKVKAQNPRDHSTVTLTNGATATNLMPEKEREAFTVRSKYFKPAEKSGDQAYKASNQKNVSLLNEKITVARQEQHADERLGIITKVAQNDATLAGKSIAQVEARIGTQVADRASPDGCKGPVSSRLTGQTKNLRSDNAANPQIQMPKVATVQPKKSLVPEGDKAASLKTNLQIPHLSGLKISRPVVASTNGVKSTPQENIKPSNADQDRVLVGSISSKEQLVRKGTQAPPIHSLKRKRIETSSPNIISKSPKHLLQISSMNVISKSPKHLLQSPVQGHLEENQCEFMDEEVYCNKSNIDNCKASAPDSSPSSNICDAWKANLKDLGIPYSIEKDSNVEKAEACKKELESICNMLRKKHEEAKEILVRAIVSNNKLLMLNHPLHDEKIRIVQRFAQQLTLKEIDTRT